MLEKTFWLYSGMQAEKPLKGDLRMKVLFLAAEPGKKKLDLDEECRLVRQSFQSAIYREQLEFEAAWALTTADLLRELNIHKPTIIHFSGHGAASGAISLSNGVGGSHLLEVDELSELLKTSNSGNLRLVFFNSCFGELQAQSIVQEFDCAVGATSAISDQAAQQFAITFYEGIGHGNSVQIAFDQAKALVNGMHLPGGDNFKLLTKDGIDPSNTFIVTPVSQSAAKLVVDWYCAATFGAPNTGYMVRLFARNDGDLRAVNYGVDIQQANNFNIGRLVAENEHHSRSAHGRVTSAGQQIFRFRARGDESLQPEDTFDFASFNMFEADNETDVKISYKATSDGCNESGMLVVRYSDVPNRLPVG